MHSDIQHHERRSGQVIPTKRRFDKYERIDNKDRGRPPKTYTRSQWKPSNPYKTNRVHEAEVHEDDESHADEQERHDDEDQVETAEQGEDSEGGEDDPEESDEGTASPGEEERNELSRAYVAGWRAKQKTSALKTKRGYVPPKARQTNSAGSGGSEPNARSPNGSSGGANSSKAKSQWYRANKSDTGMETRNAQKSKQGETNSTSSRSKHEDRMVSLRKRINAITGLKW